MRADKKTRRPRELTRSRLQVLLGGLWLLDGVLQLQPFMLTGGFAHDVVLPAASGQPLFVASVVRLAARLMAAAPLAADLAFSTAQLAIGGLLVSRRAPRAALAASVAWGLSVWWLGEGLGGIASFSGSLLSGAPGAAFFYVVASLAAWPSRTAVEQRLRPQERLFWPGQSDLAPRRVAVGCLALSFFFGAVLQLLPANASPEALAGLFGSVAVGAPGLLGAAERELAHLVLLAGEPLPVLLAAWYLLTGALLLAPGRAGRAGALLAGLTGLVAWLFGQGLGQLYSGQATDPNAGLLVVLLAAAALASKGRRREEALFEKALEEGQPLAA